MTASTRHTRAAAGGRALQVIRAGYGMVLILAPGPAIRLATGRLPSPRTCRVAQVLGARHLIQATLTVMAPRPGMFAIGAQVDVVHTASMLLLAVVSRAERRAVLTDALAEAAFAAAGRPAKAGRSRTVFPGSLRAVECGDVASRSTAGPRHDRD